MLTRSAVHQDVAVVHEVPRAKTVGDELRRGT